MSGAPTPEPEESRASARLSIAGFEGPLDLLLHLVRVGTLDIAGVSVVDVVRQCDLYIRLIEALDLEAAGDHLVMAATLVHMKSRSLLPPDPEALADEAPLEDDLPYRLKGVVTELRRAAEQLQEREAAMELIYTRPAGRIAEFAGEQGLEVDLYALVNAFQAILKRQGDGDPTQRITRETVSLMERVTWLIDTLNREKSIPFSALFEGLATRLSLILTFLAVLEVMRLRVARAFQSHHQTDILIVLAEDAPPADTEESHPDA